MKTLNQKFEIVWKVNFASMECKQGVHSIEETNETEDKGFLHNETMYSQVVDFDELKSLSHWSAIANFIKYEFTELEDSIEEEEIEEHLEGVYDDETVYLYQQRQLTSVGTPYFVYFPLQEQMDEKEFQLAKDCLDFTGKVIERKGTLV